MKTQSKEKVKDVFDIVINQITESHNGDKLTNFSARIKDKDATYSLEVHFKQVE